MLVYCGKFSTVRTKLTELSDKIGGTQWTSFAVAGLFLPLLFVFLPNHSYSQSSKLSVFLEHRWSSGRPSNSSDHYADSTDAPTSISHIVFGVAGSVNTWRTKKNYIEAWWKPNETRGFVWLERAPTDYLPWPSSSPPFRVSEDVGRFKEFDRHRMRHAIRMVRVIAETFSEDHKDVRWYVMTDDDTVIFIDNLVEVLSRYDHNKYFYIGHNSECVDSNFWNSYEMAFGGAGYALSYPLAKLLASNMDECIKRYPFLFGSDHMLQSCVADLGVPLTHERGFHQIDLTRDISGFLSSHPQQSICYDKENNWTFAVSWGYSAQIYQEIFYPCTLQRPIETFKSWRNKGIPPFMLNTRPLSNNACEAPHVLFFESIEQAKGAQIITNYIRKSQPTRQPCSSSGNHSANSMLKIRVSSPAMRLNVVGTRRECCDVLRGSGTNVTELKLRACMEDEVVA
ncbi:PREDICTED: uncharacterized protein LOC104601103 isoform X2 [Nelumbo nucifera]|uniref:Uncharacterized protein LOC104601103 isoform X2 n=1 Tax=Nelumbo nucifera TaxID=4432 RepID=A0A1U8A5V8_NELNU|nr:PREDICTED: uncharacterized protein LOC104601103 isoform X2 [Nelumbo nucifera]